MYLHLSGTFLLWHKQQSKTDSETQTVMYHPTGFWKKDRSHVALAGPFSRKMRSNRVANVSGTVIVKYRPTYEMLLLELLNIVELKRDYLYISCLSTALIKEILTAMREAGRNIVVI